MNTWPDGIRRALSQSEHELWNARNYPGTLQICCNCDSPTYRCEEDSIFIEEHGPMCECCHEKEQGR